MKHFVRRAAFAAVACFGFAAPAFAQGTPENRATLLAEITSQLRSGRPITAAELRSVLYDMVASTSAIFQDALVSLAGELDVGSPSGGPTGAGTINAAVGYYVNGVPLRGTGTVTTVICGTGMTGGTITTSGTCSNDIAANGDVWAGTVAKMLDAHVAQTSIAPVALTIATSTFTPAFGAGINEEMTLTSGCTCTIANPTGVYAGLSGFLTIIQPSSGGAATVTWGSNWKFAGNVKPTLSTANGAIDTFGVFCRTHSPDFCEVSVNGIGFQ